MADAGDAELKVNAEVGGKIFARTAVEAQRVRRFLKSASFYNKAGTDRLLIRPVNACFMMVNAADQISIKEFTDPFTGDRRK